MKHLLKHEYPELKQSEYKKACDFINGKCSQYYFLDYMRCSNGNVDDAIKFYYLDEELRLLLFDYLIKFEIQLKSDFALFLQNSTGKTTFWKHKKYYLPEAIIPGSHNRPSNYSRIKKHIQNNLNRLNFATIGPLNYAVLYASSYGTFQELFKLIDGKYKQKFIEKYCSSLNIQNYKILNCFLEGIRRVRNRCAHGSHLITIKMTNELNSLRKYLTQRGLRKNDYPNITLLESIILFIIENLYCGNEFKNKCTTLYSKYSEILKKYFGKHSLSSKIQY